MNMPCEVTATLPRLEQHETDKARFEELRAQEKQRIAEDFISSLGPDLFLETASELGTDDPPFDEAAVAAFERLQKAKGRMLIEDDRRNYYAVLGSIFDDWVWHYANKYAERYVDDAVRSRL